MGGGNENQDNGGGGDGSSKGDLNDNRPVDLTDIFKTSSNDKLITRENLGAAKDNLDDNAKTIGDMLSHITIDGKSIGDGGP